MAYHDTKCPCGSRKPTDTMICPDCERHVAGTFDRLRMDDQTATMGQRRGAAIRVLAVCRRRQPSLALAFTTR